MKQVFGDTAYWIALLNPNDQWNQRAKQARDDIAASAIVTSEAVLTELLNYFCEHGSEMRAHAVRVVRDLLTDEQVEVVPNTTKSFLNGLDLYDSRLDKGYSLTDCISMLIMRERGIADVLTTDKHFRQEQFNCTL